MDNIVKQLKDNKVGVMPTDTIYGILGKALNPKVVERIYQIKDRNHSKPFIVLISEVDDLKLFGIEISPEIDQFLNQIWPNPVSVVLNCDNSEFEYLHRGQKSLAFRIPDHPIREIIEQTGPLVAPSANLEGGGPSETIEQAKDYFGDDIDFYQDTGKLKSPPSTLIKVEGEKIEILRQGAFNLGKQ